MLKSSQGNTTEKTRKEYKFPTEITETEFLRKPFGLRINKGSLKVTLVEPRGSSIGRIGVGDEITAVNHRKLGSVKDLNEQLAKPENAAYITLKRSAFSCCKHMVTTIETLTIEKGSAMKMMRAIEVYMVQIHIETLPDMDLSQELGVSVQYDNKERLQVASIIPGSLSSVHLRHGDIIREVNGQHISSKTMLAFWIRHGLEKDKQVRILIETGVEADTHIEMPEDVQYIAQKQLAILRNMKPPKLKTSLTKQRNPAGPKHVSISKEEAKSLEICSDFDETTLKHVARREK